MVWAWSKVFPAHAGMSPRERSIAELIAGFPRSRGDEPDTWTMLGTLQLVFPAHAGMSLSLGGFLFSLPSFPRSRGDEPAPPLHPTHVHLFSPLTRG